MLCIVIILVVKKLLLLYKINSYSNLFCRTDLKQVSFSIYVISELALLFECMIVFPVILFHIFDMRYHFPTITLSFQAL